MSNSAPYSSAFKAAVALEAWKDADTPAALAQRFGVTEAQVLRWKEHLGAFAQAAFEISGPAPLGADLQDLIEDHELAFIVAENSTLGMVLMDARGYCLYVNRAWLQMTGYSAEEIGSRPLHELVHHHYPDGRPYPMCECPIDRALPENFDVRAHEDMFFRKDGTPFFVRCAASPIFRHGRPVATVLEVQDITLARKNAARLHESERLVLRAQEESERRLRQLANTIPQLAWMANPDGYIHWYNDRWYAYTGKTPADMEGWGWQDVHAPEELPIVLETWQRAIATGTRAELTFPIRGKDGVFRPFYTIVEPLKDAAGNVLHWFGTNTDVSELEKAQEELREANRRKDQFLAMLAHELRNPLAPISAAAQLLAIGAGDKKNLEKAAEVITRQVGHMTELIDDLLDVSRVTRGVIQLEKQPVDIESVVAAAIEQTNSLMEARRHKLTLRTSAADAMVFGDKTRLIQVVSNVLSNAAKYTPQGGKICVFVEQESDAVEIRVSDNGSGIDSELMPHIFDLFTQGTRTPDRAQGGLGLGLTLVKTLIQMHGGRVAAQSAGPGKGSTFTITLPLHQAGEAAPAEHRARNALRPSRSPLSVMIVDDNEDAARTLGELLAAAGHNVRVLHAAPEALAAALADPAELFILDIGLPEMDGYELARRLRAHPKTVDATLVAVTGYGQSHDKVLARSAGFDFHFTKPLSHSDLAFTLENVR